MDRRYRNLLYILLLTCAWLIAPQIAYADNCSSLNDCYYTLRAALAAAVGLGVFAALMAIGLDMGPLIGNLKGKFRGLAPDARGGAEGSAGEGAGGVSPTGLDPGDVGVDIWDRSLGVVPVEGMVAGHGAPATRSAGSAGTQQGAQIGRGVESRASDQAPPHGYRSGDQARDVTLTGDEGRQAGQVTQQTGSGQAGMGQPPETPGVAERAEDATQIAGQADEPRQLSVEGKPAPDQGVAASEQGQPPPAEPAGQERMSQAAPQADAPGDTGRTVQEPGAEDRTPDRPRVESEPSSAERPAGRSGDWSGEGGERATGVPDSGDVADRAGEVAEAFDDAERMAQATERPPSSQDEASTQATAPREAPQQSFKPADSSPAQEAPERMAQARPPSEQGSPPTAGGAAGGEAPAVESGGASSSSPVDVAADLMHTYADLARVPGVRLLLQQVAVNSLWAARGAAAQMGIARRLGQQGANVARVEDVVEGRHSADIVLEDGPVIEVKNYYWAGPFFQQEENVADATRRLVRQVELLRGRYPDREVRVGFSDLGHTPRQMRFVLHSIGIEVVQISDAALPRPQDVVGEGFVAALRRTTVEAYWSRLAASGWVAEADPSLQERVRAAFERDAGSAWLALAVYAFDGESIFETNPLGESYAAHIQMLSTYSQGALQPSRIAERVQNDVHYVGFENGGRRYVSRAPANSDYFAVSVLDAINDAIADRGEQRRFVPLAAPDQMIYLGFVSESSYSRAQAAGVVPGN